MYKGYLFYHEGRSLIYTNEIAFLRDCHSFFLIDKISSPNTSRYGK